MAVQSSIGGVIPLPYSVPNGLGLNLAFTDTVGASQQITDILAQLVVQGGLISQNSTALLLVSAGLSAVEASLATLKGYFDDEGPTDMSANYYADLLGSTYRQVTGILTIMQSFNGS